MATRDERPHTDPRSGEQPGGEKARGDQQEGERAEAAGQDDVRARFREALDRKNAARHATTAGPDDAAHGPHSATGPAKAQRQFRRKSG